MKYAKIFVLSLMCAMASQTQAQVSVADMQQDIALMRREVADLKTEVENLRRENQNLAQRVAKAERSNVASKAVAAQVAGVRSQTNIQIEKMKREIIEQVKKDLESITSQTNQQMTRLATAISKAPQQEVQKNFSEDYPKTGIPYTVKSGDSISKLAREYNSRIKWIQDANRINNVDKGLRVGQEIFIPQK